MIVQQTGFLDLDQNAEIALAVILDSSVCLSTLQTWPNTSLGGSARSLMMLSELAQIHRCLSGNLTPRCEK